MKNSSLLIAVVYHSENGHTAKQAKAVASGVKKFGAQATLCEVDGEFTAWGELEKADAIIFGAPTYMGSASAQFKKFMDESSKNVFYPHFKWKNKVAAGFTNSASQAGDKSETLSQFTVFAAQHGMHWVNLGLPPANNSSTGSEKDLNRLGYWLGAAAQSNADEGAEATPPLADLQTASYLGERVADVVAQLKAGLQYINHIGPNH
jgi:NAD(P)H dehydrogenase (quinone)